MTELPYQKKIILKGKVVEISFKEGKQIVKLVTQPSLVEFTIESNSEVHLDDDLTLDGNFLIDKIIHESQNNLVN